MPDAVAASVWIHDLPVCFPRHPCVDYPPFTARAINLTTSLTPFSFAIAIACFVLLAVGLVLIAHGLRPRAGRVRLRVVALSTALILVGAVVESLADARLGAIGTIFGLEGAGSPDPYGSWVLVSMAARTMAVAGVASLVITASIAVVWLRNALDAHTIEEQPDASRTLG